MKRKIALGAYLLVVFTVTLAGILYAHSLKDPLSQSIVLAGVIAFVASAVLTPLIVVSVEWLADWLEARREVRSQWALYTRDERRTRAEDSHERADPEWARAAGGWPR